MRRKNKTLSRREILKIGALISSGAYIEPFQEASGEAGKKTKILIIGAGLSGLTAARKLSDCGLFEVVVLEGRDRIGGRIWTDRSSFPCPVDLGASWIHGNKKNPLFALASAEHIKLLETENGVKPATFFSNGKVVDEVDRKRIESAYRKVHNAAAEKQDSLKGKDIPLSLAFEQVLQNIQLDPTEEAGVRHLIAAEIENEYSTDGDNLSFQEWDADASFHGEDLLVPDGYDQLLKPLARGIEIKLKHVVTSIVYNKSGVTVRCDNGSEHKADFTVITLPLGVLKSGKIKFSPDLPARKKEAIDSLGMGVFDKTYLSFPSRFWPEDLAWIEYIGKNPQQWPMFLNLWKVESKPVLVAFNVGRFARELESKTDDEIANLAMLVLRKMYGSSIPDPIATKTTRWGADPFALGSYSYVPVGKSAKLFDLLQEPVASRLFFAGEATNSSNYSAADAAYLSGIKVADELKKILENS